LQHKVLQTALSSGIGEVAVFENRLIVTGDVADAGWEDRTVGRVPAGRIRVAG
jgi:hypothetical protein